MPDIREEKLKQYLNMIAAKMIDVVAETTQATVDYNIMMGNIEDPTEEGE